ncbi:Transcriptional regulator WAR1 [Pleurostoma richardsiae]|uniref:Transcriptional regulator WAR1 n=1 Tax=Pleurostoma richardsiae TaxID=41990 RepID=A0AA38VMQ7_9PEZI|nr:Transcriptional regulator WAR1 [Pleurostoma richardsiae]
MDALDPRLRPAGDPTSTGRSATSAQGQSSGTSTTAAASQQQAPTGPSYTGSTSFSPSTPASASAATPAIATGIHHHAASSGAASGESPPSATSPSFAHDDLHGGGDAPGSVDPKKPRACEACRGLKVRCEPDPANPEGACRRCAKAGRSCVVTQPTRKRQKKTDSRVAELEKKIDALTATLSATRGGGGGIGGGAGAGAGGMLPGREETGHGLYGSPTTVVPEQARREWGVPAVPMAAQGGFTPRQEAQVRRQQGQSQSPYSPEDTRAVFPPPMVLAGQKRKYTEGRNQAEDAAQEKTPASSGTQSLAPQTTALAQESSRSHEYSDVVDRGIITMERAAELWTRYVDFMSPQLPGVILPEGYSVAELRKSKPTLFLSIMSAASSETPNVQRVMVKELMQTIADKVIVVGEKSLELVQAIQVAVIWYWPPEHFEELKFYQLVHMAAVMALDIGLGKKKPGKNKRHIPYTWRDHPFRKHPPPDPTSIEARRAWLTCYFLTSNTAMALHRPNLVRWTPFMTECMDVLETSPEAAPSDKYLCHLIWTHRLAEEIGVQFAMDDPSAVVNIADARTQYALRGFERDLDRYQASVPKEMLHPSLKLSFYVMNLYMHEIALHTDGHEDFKPPFSADSLAQTLINDAALTPAHINALSACLTAIDGIFETFLAMDVASIRCLPVFNFVRVAYATVVLIKMYFAASSPDSELGKVINKDHMKVEQHLDALLDKFRATAADDKCRPAAKFLVVLVMIRSWFQKQGKEITAATAASGGPSPATEEAGTPFQPPRPGSAPGSGDKAGAGSGPTPGSEGTVRATPVPQEYSGTANTPLQLLSEVATNDHAASTPGPGGGANRTPGPPMPGGMAPNFYYGQPFMYDSTGDNSAASSAPGAGVAGADAAGGRPAGPHPGTAVLQGNPLPWLNNSFNADLDYPSLMDGAGLAQAMDLTLAGLTEGTAPVEGYENGMRYVMMEPWFMDGMSGANMFQF